jgi:hypothetical protein
MSRGAALLFVVGLLLPAGAVQGGDGAVRAVSGFQMLNHAALVSFPFALLALPALPLGIQAALGLSKRAVWGGAAGLFLLAIPGAIASTGGRFDGAHLAWLAAAALMLAAGVVAAIRRGLFAPRRSAVPR